MVVGLLPPFDKWGGRGEMLSAGEVALPFRGAGVGFGEPHLRLVF